MATTTRREEPPRPRAGPRRSSPGWKKAARLAGFLILLPVLILTFDKTVFLYRLAGAALRSGAGGPGFLAAMARCAYARPGLLPLLGPEAADPEFVAAWLAEHLRRGDGRLQESDTQAFLKDAAAKFPDNLMLDGLGIYGNNNEVRNWRDLDALFFRLAGDPAFNSLSYPALIRAFREGRLPPEAMEPLLSYLDWAGNPALAEKLREGGEIVPLRAKAVPEPIPPAGADDVQGCLARLLKIDPAQLALGENLVTGQDFSDRAQFERSWEFLDMSGRAPFAKGSFIAGLDHRAGAAFRVMGFYAEATAGRLPCRAGFGRRQSIPLKPETYVFTFRYRTQGDTERPSFWLAAVEYLPERYIAPTLGGWRRVLYVFRNAGLAIPEVKPLLRMWGTGTVWFSDVGLYAVEAGGPALPAAKEELLYE